MFLDDYSDNPRDQKAQQDRKQRAESQLMYVRNLNVENCTAEIESSSGNGHFYYVTQWGCDCMDFQRRGKPCKHMYKLQMEIDKARRPAALPKEKSKTTALLFCIFFGYVGGHYFYVGRVGMGVLYLLTVGIFGFGWLFDIYRIAAGKFCDSDGVILE